MRVPRVRIWMLMALVAAAAPVASAYRAYWARKESETRIERFRSRRFTCCLFGDGKPIEVKIIRPIQRNPRLSPFDDNALGELPALVARPISE